MKKIAGEEKEKITNKKVEDYSEEWETLKEKGIAKLKRYQTHDALRINVGGQLFIVTRETLLSTPENHPTLFSLMFADNQEWKPQPLIDKGNQSTYFIDRSPACFPYVLDYLRNGRLPLDSLSPRERSALIKEAKFYNLKGIIKEAKDLTRKKLYFLPIDLDDKKEGGIGLPNALIERKKTFICIRWELPDWAVGLGSLAVCHGVWEWNIKLDLLDKSNFDNNDNEEGQAAEEAIEEVNEIKAYVGVVPYDVPRRGAIFNNYGWWIGPDGQVFSQSERGKDYLNDKGVNYQGAKNASVSIRLDMDKRVVAFGINGQWGDVAFNGLPYDLPLSPCVCIHSPLTSATIKAVDN